MKAHLKSFTIAAGTALVLLAATGAGAQQKSPSEIPLERCDRLPVIVVQVDKVEMHFLVDTAATSMLNLKSFSTGRSKRVQISSWNGTRSATAKEVSLPEIQLGNRRLVDVKLPAVDLSAIAKACGAPLDGIFGVDLLEQLNVTIDLKRSVAHLGVAPASPADSATIREMDEVMQGCSAAFNAADAKRLAQCLDPDFVLMSPDGEYRGRESATDHFRGAFFSSHPPVRLAMTMKDQQAVGDVVWSSYDYTLESSAVHFAGHGMMLCRKAENHWYILSMHESANEVAASRLR
jgi:ketosteroid isomerase-like protein